MYRYIAVVGVVLSLALYMGCKDKNDMNPGPGPGNNWGVISDTLPDYILYLSNREGGPILQAKKELYFLDVDRNRESQLTDNSEYENVVKFQYHSGLDKIVFTSVIRYDLGDAGLDIFLMDATTREVINLTHTQKSISVGTYDVAYVPIHTDPEFSPDGSLLLYTKMYHDSWEITALSLATMEEHILLRSQDGDYSWKARWSPDGTKILYMSEVDDFWQLFVMDADGTNQRQISSTLYAESGLWSHDGEKILYLASTYDRTSLDIYLSDADGAAIRQLTHGGRSSNHAWSSDGAYIAYKLGDHDLDHGDIHIMQSDGSSDHVITDLHTVISSLTWSKLDDKLLFASPTEEVPEIYIVKVDGSIIQQVTFSGYNAQPQWIDRNLIE